MRMLRLCLAVIAGVFLTAALLFVVDQSAAARVLGVWDVGVQFKDSKAALPAGVTRYLATSGADASDCSNPSAPCRTLQYAIDESSDGDQILLAGGVYTELTQHSKSWHPTIGYITRSLSLRGGFTLTNWTDPNPLFNPTRLDGRLQGTALVFSGVLSATVENLEITGSRNWGIGGGNSHLSIRDNRIVNSGGGIIVSDGALSAAGNVICNNHDDYGYGSGVEAWRMQSVHIQENLICNNTRGLYFVLGNGLSIISNTIDNNTFSAVEVLDASGEFRGNLVQNHQGDEALFFFLPALNNRNHVKLTHNMVVSNHTGLAPVWLLGGGFELANNLIAKNSGGSGIYGEVVGPITIHNNRVIDNFASGDRGGGIFVYANAYHPVTITHNLVAGNYGAYSGGGIYLNGGCCSMSSPRRSLISNNIFLSNTAAFDGAGVLSVDTPWLEFSGNLVAHNTAGQDGGGLSLSWIDYPDIESFSAEIQNNMLVGNHAGGHGSGAWISGTQALMVNNTIGGNTGGGGEGVYVEDSFGKTVALTNTLLFSQAVGLYAAPGSQVSLDGTLWGGGAYANGLDWAGPGVFFTGTTNLWGDPRFVDPDLDDYHLQRDSPAVDAGLPVKLVMDIDGEPRPQIQGYDIGADELLLGLRLAHAANTGLAAAGQPLTFTLQVTNLLPGPQTFLISDVLPSGVTPTGFMTWTAVISATGGVWSKPVRVTTLPTYAGELTNLLQVCGLEGCASLARSVQIVAPLSGLAAAASKPTPLGSATSFTANITAGSDVTFSWDFGDGSQAAGALVTFTYPAPGVYTATVTAANPLGSLTGSTTAWVVKPLAGLAAGASTPTLLGAPTAFSATLEAGSDVTFSWDFGDGSAAYGAFVTHTYTAPGAYQVIVAAVNPLGSLLNTLQVEVFVLQTRLYLPLLPHNASQFQSAPVRSPDASPAFILSNDSLTKRSKGVKILAVGGTCVLSGVRLGRSERSAVRAGYVSREFPDKGSRVRTASAPHHIFSA